MQILEEMSETVPKEFHFGREARLMRIIGARLHRSGFHTILVAQPLLALCSPNLLVMERMSGEAWFINCSSDNSGLPTCSMAIRDGPGSIH